MIEQINVRLVASQRATTQFVTLSEVRIGLKFQYMKSFERWMMWLLATDSTEIAGPIRLVPGLDLLLPFKYDPRIPPGQLFINGDPPTSETVDVSSRLLYRP